jgi:hypothetical protein
VSGKRAKGRARDRFEIIEVVQRYATAADTRDWKLLDQTFTPDVRGDFGEFQLRDVEGVRAMMRQHLDGCGPTQHLLGNFRIEIDGDTAHCTCAVRAFHAGRGANAHLTYELFGEYRDELVRTGAGWRIAARSMHISHEMGHRGILGPA